MGLLVLAALAALGWFWSDSLRARESMTAACTRICQDMHLQFLDETVALARLRLARAPGGNLTWRRLYVFEFSESGADRWKGRAQLIGRRVESVQLDNPQGITILGGVRPASSLIVKDSDDPNAEHHRLQ
ncbi:MAG: DUF3301 domain-containing protein [Gammaproteobacteria bacterium]|nr:DUF3301 domain-containing protein [Gammaproteobacteria bacterium]